jgi:hypothetical protein
MIRERPGVGQSGDRDRAPLLFSRSRSESEATSHFGYGLIQSSWYTSRDGLPCRSTSTSTRLCCKSLL